MKKFLLLSRKIVAHPLLILFVVIAPVSVYIWLSQTEYGRAYQLVGGITYPLYVLYLISKLKNVRAKFILSHIVCILVMFFLAIACIGDMRKTSDLLALSALGIPMLIAIIPFFLSRFFRMRGDAGLAATCRVSGFVVLPIGIALTLVMLFVGMSSGGLSHW